MIIENQFNNTLIEVIEDTIIIKRGLGKYPNTYKRKIEELCDRE